MSEIELILTKLKIVSEEKENGMYLCDKEHSKILLDYIQQKENIIKEVREFAKLRKEMYERQENVVGQEVIISLLNILDKGEQNGK